MTNSLAPSSFQIQTPQKIGAVELNSLTPAERLEAIRSHNGKSKYEMILNATDGELLVPKLHPQEIYLTISAIGPEFSSELILLSSTEQITTLLDLDCWEEDRIDQKTTLQWLNMILETGPEKASKTIIEMEPELVALMLKSFIRILAGPEVYDNDDAEENANRLEGLYDIDYCDEEAAKVIGGLLKTVQDEDPKAWMQLLELVRSELDSVLEEEVYQARNVRLNDYGFVTPAEARSIYTKVEPATFTPTTNKEFQLESEGLESPLPLLRMAQPGGLLAEVLSAGINHSLATELCFLANRKMTADLVDLSREEAVSEALSQLYDGLNLGLEHLAGNDVHRAGAIFREAYLQQIFQLGYSLTKDLANRGKELLSAPAGKFIDGPFRRFIECLQQNPPMLFCGIRVGDPQQPEEIRTRKQLKCIETILGQIELQQQLFSSLILIDLSQPDEIDLDNCNIESVTDLTLSDLFLTALANQLLGGEFAPQPIAACELPTLHRLLVQDGKLNTKLVEQVRNQLDNQLAGASTFADYCLEIWQEEFCQIEETDIEPRYLSGLIIRLSD